MLAFQGNNALKLKQLNPPRFEQALRLQRDVYEGYLKRNGEEHPLTLRAATNLAVTRNDLKRYKEVKASRAYAIMLYTDPSATLDDLREAVTTLEETTRTTRRVLGGAHPLTSEIEEALGNLRAALRAHDTPSTSG